MNVSSMCKLRYELGCGRVSVREVVEALIPRLSNSDGMGIWVEREVDDVLRRRADELDRIRGSGGVDLSEYPLFGVPFAVKDNIDVAGFSTTVGCPGFAHVAAKNAHVVDLLLGAGGVFVGKTNMDQFAIGLTGVRSPYGVPVNPFAAEYIAGGSSSGSAVAVARGLVCFALGTDTAGSIRVPASFNGVIGIKPSIGRVSCVGVVPTCKSIDCVGVLASDIESARIAFAVCDEFDSADPFSRKVQRSNMRERVRTIGVVPKGQRVFYDDAGAAEVYAQGLQRLERAGFRCVELDFGPLHEAAELLYNGAFMAERDAVFGDFVMHHADELLPATVSALQSGGGYSASDLVRCSYRLRELQRRIEIEMWSRMDAIFVPTVGRVCTIEEAQREPGRLMQQLSYYTNYANLLDMCAVAVPAGFSREGVPLGTTLLSTRFRDEDLMDAAALFVATAN